MEKESVVVAKYQPRPWLDDEEQSLWAMRNEGIEYKFIAMELGRTVESCKTKYRDTIWQNKPWHYGYQSTIRNAMKKEHLEKVTRANDRRIENSRVKMDIIADRLATAVQAIPKVPKPFIKRAKKTHSPEDVGLIISDAHIGHTHTMEETGGLSEYNIDVFKKRAENLKLSIGDIYDLHSHLYELPTLNIMALGDIVAGMNNAGAWSSVYISSDVHEQVILGVEAFADIIYYALNLFENINFYGVMGNHGRCNSSNTRILTPQGYKRYTEIKEGDLVGTITKDGKFQFQPILKVHIFGDDSSIINVKTKSLDMKCTKDHDVLVRSRGKCGGFSKIKANALLESKATSYSIPISCESGKGDMNISDDMLRLIGYIITDGHYTPVGDGIIIYQSKTDVIKRITKLFERMNIEYSDYTSDRKISNIMNRQIISQKEQHGFYLKTSNKEVKRVREILPIKNSIPSWMYSLSDRQVSILLEAIVDGDGSYREGRMGKDGFARSGGMDVVWGSKEFLESLSGLLISHNVPCSVNLHKRNNKKYVKDGTGQVSYYLQIRKNKNFKFYKRDVSEQPYADKSWCVTVDNGAIAVLSEDGDPYFTGNCAMKGQEKEYINWDYICYEYLQQRFRDNPRVKFEIPKTWWAMPTIRNHKFLLLHGDDVRGSGGTPFGGIIKCQNEMMAMLREVPDYTIIGHFHSAGEWSTNNGKVIANGSFLGPDVYALKNLTKGSKAEQKIFGIHDIRGLTWRYDIDLDMPR